MEILKLYSKYIKKNPPQRLIHRSYISTGRPQTLNIIILILHDSIYAFNKNFHDMTGKSLS